MRILNDIHRAAYAVAVLRAIEAAEECRASLGSAWWAFTVVVTPDLAVHFARDPVCDCCPDSDANLPANVLAGVVNHVREGDTPRDQANTAKEALERLLFEVGQALSKASAN